MRWSILLTLVCAVLAVGCSMDTDPRDVKPQGRGSALAGSSYGWSDLVRFDGITYEQLYGSQEAGRPLRKDDLGPKFAEVRHQVDDEGLHYRVKNGDAAYHEVGTPVYSVEGYATSFRLAVPEKDGRLGLYEAVSNPRAKEGSDLLDIDGKVRRISVTDQEDVGAELGTIEDPKRVQSLVRGLMDAPVEQRDPDYMGDVLRGRYLVVFHLKDGTAVARPYRSDTGRLGSYGTSVVVVPEGFREAVEEALKGFLKEQEALREARVAEERREIRTCGDTQTTNETRMIDRGIPYTTNDVPGGPSAGMLRGTDGADKLAGENGEDEVRGLDGDDTVEGGVCDDEVYGGLGDDYMMGAGAMDPDERGDDTLYGGSGNDEINGDRGDDVLYGGDGDDSQLIGYFGEDTIYGDEGDDFLDAQKDGQPDMLYCGGGRDHYTADEVDVVADDCEVKTRVVAGEAE